MITVRCIGHIGTSVGAREVTLEGAEMDASEIVERVREMSGMKDPGFDRYNTLVMVEDGEAFVAAGTERRMKGSERVVLIPFSHGG